MGRRIGLEGMMGHGIGGVLLRFWIGVGWWVLVGILLLGRYLGRRRGLVRFRGRFCLGGRRLDRNLRRHGRCLLHFVGFALLMYVLSRRVHVEGPRLVGRRGMRNLHRRGYVSLLQVPVVERVVECIAD